jgi:hypothetical protein
MYFPHYFDQAKFRCPKCHELETPNSMFENQGFTYQPRFIYGLSGIEYIAFVSVYRHRNCGAAAVSSRTGKRGSSTFSALHPGMTAQNSDVVRAWYPFVVGQRTIVTRAVEVFNGACRLSGVRLAAVASCLAETANSIKTVLENAQMLAEVTFRRCTRSSTQAKR